MGVSKKCLCSTVMVFMVKVVTRSVKLLQNHHVACKQYRTSRTWECRCDILLTNFTANVFKWANSTLLGTLEVRLFPPPMGPWSHVAFARTCRYVPSTFQTWSPVSFFQRGGIFRIIETGDQVWNVLGTYWERTSKCHVRPKAHGGTHR